MLKAQCKALLYFSQTIFVSLYKWKNLETPTKSRWVYNAKKFSRDKFGYKIKANNSEIYRKMIPNTLTNMSKRLGYAGLGVNLIENGKMIYDTGQIGLGNAVEIGATAIGTIPGFGIVVGIGYIGADYLWYQYSGYTINQSLNSVFSIKW